MTIFTDGWRLASPGRPITDYEASFGEQLGATAAEAWSDSPTSQLLGVAELDRAAGIDYSRFSAVDDATTFGGPQEPVQRPTVPTLPRAEALDRVKQAGLDKHLTMPDQDTIAAPVLDIMISRAKARAEREATIARGPQNLFAAGAGLGTSFLVGAIDPINLASAFIPIMGELRYGKLLASAGESAFARAGVRAGVGAAQGVVGQAVLEPLDWYAHTQEGRDFGMADVLHNLVFGAALGGGLHSAGGAIGDVVRARQGRPLYPFDLGEPLEHHTAWDELRSQPQPPPIPRDVLGEFPGLDVEATRRAAAPIEILRDLPPRAQEDSMRAALASIIDGEPVKVGEMLEVAAKSDPRIAESLDLARPPLELVAAPEGGVYTPDQFKPGEHYFKAVDGDGNVSAEVLIRIDGETARVEDILNPGAPREAGVGSLGPAQLRGLLAQFRRLHPEITTITGTRVSGARMGGRYSLLDDATETSVRLPVPDQPDRAAPAAPSADDWHSLLQRADEVDHPDILEASRAADELPEVKTRLDERVSAAEQADARAEELYRMFADELPEADRARLEDSIKSLDDEHKLDSDVIARAAACAFRARA